MAQTTIEHLGPEAREIDAQAYDVALAFLDDDGDEWLWNNGDFWNLLETTLQMIVDSEPSENISAPMRLTAQTWLTDRAIA